MASSPTTLALDLCGSTHVGQVRSHNEDNFLLLPDLNQGTPSEDELVKVSVSEAGTFIMVADGMGGGAAGEVASEMAKSFCLQRLSSLNQWPESDEDRLSILCEMIIGAHGAIADRSLQNVDLLGMGTTATLVLILDNKAYIAWSGDSRVYRYNPRGVEQDRSYQLPDMQILIDEHSVVWDMVRQGKISPESARIHPESHIITQNLGFADEAPFPDSKVVNLYQGDRLLVCSDGLNSMLSDPEIRGILSGQKETVKTVQDLIQASNAAGGHDNITVVLADVLQGPAPEHAILQKTGEERIITKQMIGGKKEVASANAVATLSKKSKNKAVATEKAPTSKLLFWGILSGFLLIGTYFILESYLWNEEKIENLPQKPDKDEKKTDQSELSIDTVTSQESTSSTSGQTTKKKPDSTKPEKDPLITRRIPTKIEWVNNSYNNDTFQVGDSLSLTVTVTGENPSMESYWKVEKEGKEIKRIDDADKSESFPFKEPGQFTITFIHNGKKVSTTVNVVEKPIETIFKAIAPIPQDNKWEADREKLLDEIERIREIATQKQSRFQALPSNHPLQKKSKEIDRHIASLDQVKDQLRDSLELKSRETIRTKLDSLKNSIGEIRVPGG